jgi:hypothetical protein
MDNLIIIQEQFLRSMAKTLTSLNLQVNQLSQMVKEARLNLLKEKEVKKC